MIEISSKLRANTALMKPPRAKILAVRVITSTVTPRWCTCRSVKNIDSSRSEEHTSELQSLMRISYAVFCLKKKNRRIKYTVTPDIREHIQTYLNDYVHMR